MSNDKAKPTKKISDYLTEIGESDTVSYSFLITKSDGSVIQKQQEIAGDTSLNELMAFLLWVEALSGDMRSRKELLDRIDMPARKTAPKAASAKPAAEKPEPVTQLKIVNGTDA